MTLTEEQAGRMLADMNDVIRAGDDMRRLRAEVIAALAGLGWTQDRIARLTGMSQPAVSKHVARQRTGGSQPPLELSLDQHDVPWLEGRLWGLAEHLAETYDTARCARHVHAIARGRKRFTPQLVDELRRLVEEDLRLHRERLPGGCRAAYDRISRGLDVPAKVTPPAPASVRRTLARELQRSRLQQPPA
ncbi:helix-turn-helix domain-containing protein [Nonomuraea sp. SBT364]|uniref:helix-turn-helix domain-containing protein n=1 Tax=Nonomuraea sp. SBT364 TaxID=1580530 RepID=UPI000AD275B9|nr:helix-turn-helix domain-containing protein [Nonomuraea sp. SBT364]